MPIGNPSLRLLRAVLPMSLVWSACGCGDGQAHAESEGLVVEALPIERLDSYEVRRLFSGTVRSRRASHLGFERGGLVAQVLVDEGDVVSKGQVIARLDTAKLRAARKRVLAALDEAEAGVGISTLTANRLGELANDEFISRQSADEARFGLQAAEAKRRELEAARAQIDVDLRKSKLVAPFAGIVSARLVDEGTVVASGTPIIRFRESDQKEAVVGVPVSLKVPVGSEQELILGAERLLAPVIARVDDVDAQTRTVTLIFALPDGLQAAEGEVIRLGYARTVPGSGFWVPSTALTQGLRGMWTVYSIKEGQVAREAVEILHTETDRAFVRGTLEDGDLIVPTGLHRVVPGQHVRPSSTIPPEPLEIEP